MKKKGLIIATIVMVLVLAVSLTTATYAWFTTASSASIETVQMNVGAASNVAIGVNSVALTNENKTSQASYMSGSVTYDGTKWSGGNDVLGTTIATGTTLNVTAGVGTGHTGGYVYTAKDQSGLLASNYIEQSGNSYIWTSTGASATLYTFTSGTSTYSALGARSAGDAYDGSTYYTRESAGEGVYEMDATYTPANTLLKANGNSFNTLNTPELAIINGNTSNNETIGQTDVLDLQMAINPVKSGIYGTYCAITITPVGSYMGMITALWADVTVGSNSVTAVDLFDLGTAKHFDTSNPANGTYTFYFMIDAVSGTEMVANDSSVTPFSIRLYISGYDEDCVTSATGTSAAIDLKFYGVTKPDSTYVYEGIDDAIAIAQAFAHA